MVLSVSRIRHYVHSVYLLAWVFIVNRKHSLGKEPLANAVFKSPLFSVTSALNHQTWSDLQIVKVYWFPNPSCRAYSTIKSLRGDFKSWVVQTIFIVFIFISWEAVLILMRLKKPYLYNVSTLDIYSAFWTSFIRKIWIRCSKSIFQE